MTNKENYLTRSNIISILCLSMCGYTRSSIYIRSALCSNGTQRPRKMRGSNTTTAQQHSEKVEIRKPKKTSLKTRLRELSKWSAQHMQRMWSKEMFTRCTMVGTHTANNVTSCISGVHTHSAGNCFDVRMLSYFQFRSRLAKRETSCLFRLKSAISSIIFRGLHPQWALFKSMTHRLSRWPQLNVATVISIDATLSFFHFLSRSSSFKFHVVTSTFRYVCAKSKKCSIKPAHSHAIEAI